MSEQDSQKEYVVVQLPIAPKVQELLEAWKERGTLEVIECPAAQNVKEAVMRVGPCMVIMSIKGREEIAVTATSLKLLADEIKYNLIKTLVLSEMRNKQLSQFITSQGVNDYVEEPVQTRTLLFKANLQLRAVETIKKREAGKKAAKEKMLIKSEEIAKSGGKMGSGEVKQNAKPALELGEDCFLFRNRQAKRNGKNMVLEMDGPTDKAGAWNPLEPKEDGTTRWQWLPNEEKDKKADPTKGKGAGWVHEGEKPSFDPSTGRWKMISEKPDLSFYRDGRKEASKVTTDAKGEIEVATDSPQAEDLVKKVNPVAEAVANGETPRLKNKLQKPAPEKQATIAAEPGAGGATGFGMAEKDGATTAKPAPKTSPFTPKGVAEKAAAAAAEKEKAEAAGEETEEAKQLRNKQKKAGPGKEMKMPGAEAGAGGSTGFGMADKGGKREEGKGGIRNKTEENAKAEQSLTETPPAERQAEVKSAGKLNDKTREGEKEDAEAKEQRSKNKKPQQKSLDDVKASPGLKQLMQANKKVAAFGKPEEKKPFNASVEQERYETGRITQGNKGEKSTPQKRKELIEKLKQEAAAPVPEQLSDAEKKEIAAELGVDAEKTPPAELAKRRKLEKMKKLKQEIEALEAGSLGDAGSAQNGEDGPGFTAFQKENKDNTQSQRGLSADQRGRGLRASDSDFADPAQESDSKKKGLKSDPKAAVGRKKIEYFHRHLDELPYADGVWTVAEQYYVYLATDSRYHGFQSFESLLPLWVYEGDIRPEFLKDTKRWRFAHRNAEPVKSVADIPPAVRRALEELNDRLKKTQETKEAAAEAKAEEKAAAKAEADKEAKAEEKKSKTGETAAAQSEEKGKAEAAEPVPTFGQKKKQKAEAAAEAQAQAEEKKGKQGEEKRGPETLEEKKARIKEELAKVAEASKKEREKQAEAEAAEEAAQKESNKALETELAAAKAAKKAKQDAQNAAAETKAEKKKEKENAETPAALPAFGSKKKAEDVNEAMKAGLGRIGMKDETKGKAADLVGDAEEPAGSLEAKLLDKEAKTEKETAKAEEKKKRSALEKVPSAAVLAKIPAADKDEPTKRMLQVTLAVLFSDAITSPKRALKVPLKLAAIVKDHIKDAEVTLLLPLSNQQYEVVASTNTDTRRVETTLAVEPHAEENPPYLLAGNSGLALWVEKSASRSRFTPKDRDTLYMIMRFVEKHWEPIGKRLAEAKNSKKDRQAA